MVLVVNSFIPRQRKYFFAGVKSQILFKMFHIYQNFWAEEIFLDNSLIIYFTLKLEDTRIIFWGDFKLMYSF